MLEWEMKQIKTTNATTHTKSNDSKEYKKRKGEINAKVSK